MPIHYNTGVIPEQGYPTTIGVEYNTNLSYYDSIKLNKTVEGTLKARSFTANNRTLPIIDIAHTVNLADKQLLEEHYAINRTQSFYMLIPGVLNRYYYVKYIKEPTISMLGGNFYKIENSFVETLSTADTNPPNTLNSVSDFGYGWDSNSAVLSTFLNFSGGEYGYDPYSEYPPTLGTYRTATFSTISAPDPGDQQFAELLGYVINTNGGYYFEIEIPNTCTQAKVGLLIGDATLSTIGDSTYYTNLPNYDFLTFNSDTGGAREQKIAGTITNQTFDTPWDSLFLNPGDTIRFDVDCTLGTITTLYINGVIQDITDPDFAVANSWTPYSQVRPFIQFYNKPVLDATPPLDMEATSVKLNTSLQDFKYSSENFYSNWDSVGIGMKPNNPIQLNILNYIGLFGNLPTGFFDYNSTNSNIPIWYGIIYDDGEPVSSSTIEVTFNITGSISYYQGYEVYPVLAIYNDSGVCIAETATTLSKIITFKLYNEKQYYLVIKSVFDNTNPVYEFKNDFRPLG